MTVDVPIEDRTAIRKRGLISAGTGLGGIVFMRLIVELEIAFHMGSPMIAGAAIVLFPVVAAFGLTTFVTGSEKGWLRIPLVVIFAILLIAFAFYVIIPHGYTLEGEQR